MSQNRTEALVAALRGVPGSPLPLIGWVEATGGFPRVLPQMSVADRVTLTNGVLIAALVPDFDMGKPEDVGDLSRLVARGVTAGHIGESQLAEAVSVKLQAALGFGPVHTWLKAIDWASMPDQPAQELLGAILDVIFADSPVTWQSLMDLTLLAILKKLPREALEQTLFVGYGNAREGTANFMTTLRSQLSPAEIVRHADRRVLVTFVNGVLDAWAAAPATVAAAPPPPPERPAPESTPEDPHRTTARGVPQTDPPAPTARPATPPPRPAPADEGL